LKKKIIQFVQFDFFVVVVPVFFFLFILFFFFFCSFSFCFLVTLHFFFARMTLYFSISTLTVIALTLLQSTGTQALVCWQGTSNAGYALDCQSSQDQCISYSYKCQEGDTTCVAGTPFEVALCGTDAVCQSVKTLPDASNIECCKTASCNGARLVAAAKGPVCGVSGAGQAICSVETPFCASYDAVCMVAGAGCTEAQVNTTVTFRVCANKDLCDSITSPQAAAFYKNAVCSDPKATTAAVTGSGADVGVGVTSGAAGAATTTATKDSTGSAMAVQLGTAAVVAIVAILN
jgi:hypothetical protein